ncbi:putative transcriptional regulatory protein [Colletotrichum tanaceti]|uniref:Putative transcriptional regulatory protein n=1 Tax=Colletotrichum tanaceti TaxID=1306861 RepID=A0A4U6XC39_9PEZI|nr:putative transcriptional regulatory protein [Colletotrichum tanaceti]KAJ0164598.1 putative transcriptional regulatory protein [Colletotrichum tanaceti]TKW52652.1 putative transcriptional regulatory protein [Colletotrichum tanaceti]
METSSQRRKACDLCFVKKIKCDMLKSACSNCILYKTECKTTPVRRRVTPARERQQQQQQHQPKQGTAGGDPTKVEELESRLARIEEQLQRALDANERLSSQAPPPPFAATSRKMELPAGSSGASGSPGNPGNPGNPPDDTDFNNAPSCSPSPSPSPSEWVVEPERPKLPPPEDIMPVIDEFFGRYNSIMPLFDQETFMRMLSDWYSPCSQRSPAVWAAINIAIALGYRCTLKEPGDVDALIEDQKVLHHMRNVQSVVSDLVTREEDLLGIQVLVGMVVLFQGTKDPKPASVLIGTAVRLAHRMQLHDRDSHRFFPPEIARQRSRVFWMVYVMDKEISLRAKTPSFQLDADIDLALPELCPNDGAGIIAAKSGSEFNFFRARVELSHIAGKVYDLLYSTRARKVLRQESQSRVTRLEEMLESWYGMIPAEFRLESVLQNIDALPAVHMSLLYHHYFMVVVMTHGIYSHDADWVHRISSYCRTAMRDLDGVPVAASLKQNAPIPDGWERCVDLSRRCMKLFAESPMTDCSIWTNSCAHFSGLIIILSNMFVYPEHEHLVTDQALASHALHLFDMMLEVSNKDAFRRLHVVVRELHRRAMATVERAAQKRDGQAAAAAVAEAINNSLPFGMQFEEDVSLFEAGDMGWFDGIFDGSAIVGSPVTVGSETADTIEGIQEEVCRATMTVGYSHY